MKIATIELNVSFKLTSVLAQDTPQSEIDELLALPTNAVAAKELISEFSVALGNAGEVTNSTIVDVKIVDV